MMKRLMEFCRKMIFDGDEVLSVQLQMIDFCWLCTHQRAVSSAQDMIIIHWRKGQLIKWRKSSCHPITDAPTHILCYCLKNSGLARLLCIWNKVWYIYQTAIRESLICKMRRAKIFLHLFYLFLKVLNKHKLPCENSLLWVEAVQYNWKSSLQFGYSQSRSMLLNHLCYQWSSKNKAIDHEMNFVTSLM